MKSPPKVALIIETSGIYGRRILSGIAKFLSAHHRWSVFIEQHELGTRPPKWMRSMEWDGILTRSTDPEMAEAFRQMQSPVVDLNDQYESLGLPWVGSDHRGIGALGAAHVLERGLHHFGFCGYSGELWSSQRFQGFRQVVLAKSFDVSVFESPRCGAKAPQWDCNVEEIAHWLQRLPKPVAIMTANDVRALHVIDACNRSGLLVPEDVAVLGVDDEEILCELCTPALSSVAPNPEAIGYKAAELLAALMAGEAPAQQWITVPPKGVVARQSTDLLAMNDRLVANAVRFMREQALHGCTVKDVIQKFGVCRGALENRFQKALNRSPKQVIHRIQLERIQELLIETDFTLEHIAELAGFDHPEYMSVLFKRETGLTPGAFRKAARK